MPSPNLLKSKIPMSGEGGKGGGGVVDFDAESKFAEIQNTSVWWGGGGGGCHLSILHTHSTPCVCVCVCVVMVVGGGRF